MMKKLAAVALASILVPAAAFACDGASHASTVKREQPKVVLAQADSKLNAAKKETASTTAQTTAQTGSNQVQAPKKAKPKAKALSQPKTATPTK